MKFKIDKEEPTEKVLRLGLMKGNKDGEVIVYGKENDGCLWYLIGFEPDGTIENIGGIDQSCLLDMGFQIIGPDNLIKVCHRPCII